MTHRLIGSASAIELTNEELAATIGGDGADAALVGGVGGGIIGGIWAVQTAETVATITVGAALGPIAIGILAGAAIGYAAWYLW